MVVSDVEGSAPVIGERLSLDLMNTSYSTRGKPAEGLGSPEQATSWVQRIAGRLADAGATSASEARFGEAGLDDLLALRTAMRSLADAVVSGGTPGAHDVERINRAAALTPRWSSMAWNGDARPAMTKQSAGAPADQVLSTLAGDAVDLFTGADAARLRMCERPGCDLFFLKDHPRREWCTPACGARVRAARSYQKRVQRARSASAIGASQPSPTTPERRRR
ncbi:CGNR zinc finger domain-containing protein [Cryobacterium sp. BB736]|uniref:CGNR zinc finger domain-containing protein n=1 Tax=Cryobacterium sp. BB736 TaxID=2746963 RepID=UPI001875302B